MSTVTMYRCDQCGKLAEAEDQDFPPKGWRNFPLPFGQGPASEVCSPGCAKRLLGDNVDEEWGLDTAYVPELDTGTHPFEGITYGTPDRPCTRCNLADRHPIHSVAA